MNRHRDFAKSCDNKNSWKSTTFRYSVVRFTYDLSKPSVYYSEDDSKELT